MHFEGVRCPDCGNEDVSLHGPGNENYPPSFNCCRCNAAYGRTVTFSLDTPAAWKASDQMLALSVANAAKYREDGSYDP